MDVFYTYTYGTAGWLALQALPMLASPTIVVTLLSPEAHEPSVLETYFSRALAFSHLTVGILTILLSGSVPLTSRLSGAGPASTSESDPKAPYALPTCVITTLYHAAVAFYSYAMWTQTGVFSFALGMFGGLGLGAVGLWIVLFGASDGRISRKTGADKRTSGFPFGNSEADKRKKGR